MAREPLEIGSVAEGELLWQPSAERIARSNLTAYLKWLAKARGLSFSGYPELWRWSVTDLEGFWSSVWDFFGVKAHHPYERVLASRAMPGAQWFPKATLNYAEHALRRRDDHPAIIYRQEEGPLTSLSYGQLAESVAAAACGMRRLGVRPGDRVAAYASNTPEAVIAFLAAASIGAIWSSCAPEFGTESVVDRFGRIEPALLIAVDGYRYNGRVYDRTEAVRAIAEQLPSLRACVMIEALGRPLPKVPARTVRWSELVQEKAPLEFEPVPFSHPLWILYSSGTTGLPKAIVQGHGGILLEHLKALALHLDLTASDRFFWQTTTGWMMWNFLVSGLLLGATILLYEGSPAWEGLEVLWRFAAESGMTYFGTSAPFIHACMKKGLAPGESFDLTRLAGVGSTGSPLTPEGFKWVYTRVHPDVNLGSLSGGTDVCTAFLVPCPLLPVYAGELQCRALGARVEAFDEQGRPLVGEVGELVLTEPLPSMPLFFWNDPGQARYRESYFAMYPGVWRHGDWVKITPREGAVIYGRSDSTLNRSGIRTGTSDIYRIVEQIRGVVDSLVIDTGVLGREGRLLLFVVPERPGGVDDALRERIRQALRRSLSPRHVPDEIYEVAAVPRTLNGKKLEVPVRRLLLGEPLEKVVALGAVANPEALGPFVALARGKEAP